MRQVPTDQVRCPVIAATVLPLAVQVVEWRRPRNEKNLTLTPLYSLFRQRQPW